MTDNHIRSAECDPQIETRVDDLLGQMSLPEKIGQMCQIGGAHERNKELIRQGAVGSFLYVLGEQAREFQRLAVEESRLGIPLILGADVIHGFRTVLPIPLGQAASFDPEIVQYSNNI